VRKRASKAAAAEPAQKRAGPAPASKKPASASVPTPDNDSAMAGDDGEPRRGWWQRTFG
jgi:ribonuclease E